MKRLLRDIALAAAVLAIFAVALSLYVSITTVVVRNNSNEALSNVKIGFTGKALWQGDLRAGSSKWTFGLPSQDGSVEISYIAKDSSHEIACGYVTGGPSRTSVTIDILPNGGSDCDQSY